MKQGYNSRLDDSLGAKHGKKSQKMKARRDESEGMEKSMGKRKFSGNKSSGQGMVHAHGESHGGHASVGKVLKHMNPDLAYMPVVDREKDAMKKGDM